MTDALRPVRVSICVPVFNGMPFVEAAVQSAIRECGPDDEVLVVDNASTDGTWELIRALSMSCQCVRAERNGSNLGMARNFDECIARARGRFVRILCADDLLVEGSVDAMARALQADAAASLVCGARTFIDEAGAAIGWRGYSARDLSVPSDRAASRCVFLGNLIGEPTAVMFRRDDVDGTFRADLPQLIDLEMWLRLLRKGNLLSLGDTVCAIRQHGGQLTQANARSGRMLLDNVVLVREWSERSGSDVSAWLQLRYRLHMTYSLWRLRDSVDPAVAKALWEGHVLRWAYPLMPALSVLSGVRRAWLRRRAVAPGPGTGA